MPKIFLILVILAVVGGGTLLLQKEDDPKVPSQIPKQTETEANYTNNEWKFSLKIPKGFKVQDNGDILYVVGNPTPDNETPSPDIRIKIEKGSQTAMQSDKDMTVVSSEKITVNGVQGHKIIISYKDYPEGNQCPIYKLHKSGVVYEFSLYECLESEIFETVVQSFKII